MIVLPTTTAFLRFRSVARSLLFSLAAEEDGAAVVEELLIGGVGAMEVVEAGMGESVEVVQARMGACSAVVAAGVEM